MKFIDKDLISIQESRILMERAAEARAALSGFSQGRLDEIVEAVYRSVSGHLKEFARLSVEETGYGCVEDETKQMEWFLDCLTERLRELKCVGVLAEDKTGRMKEIGIPLGIAVVLCPAQSPAAAVLSSALLCIKSGNAAVFVPDAKAVQVTGLVAAMIREAAVAAGFPEGGIGCLETAAEAGSRAAMEHEQAAVILNMGVEKLLSAAFPAEKPVLYGSSGPSPVFIERSADIEQAVADVIASRSFDCGMMPGAEQYMVADAQIAAEVKRTMIRHNAYFMAETEEQRLLAFLCPGGREMETAYIGKSAEWLAGQAGFSVPEGTKLLVSEKRYIADRNPYAKELRCPVLAFYIENDWMYACERCMKLLVEESKGHTLVIHSRNQEIIDQFAMKKPVARMLVNTPAVHGAMGMTTDLFPSMALGGLTAGQGITADNISPLNLVYIRKVGYGKRTAAISDKTMLKQLIGEIIRELNEK